MAATDFDFLLGDWHVHHRKLGKRLAGSDDWATFTGTVQVRPVLGGQGNVDDNVIDAPDGRYTANTLRLFDPVADRWSLHWVDSRRMTLDPPIVGRFADGVGTFFGDDEYDGRPVRVRFLWERHETGARWQQAFSVDGGVSWETNWTMDFSRA